MRSSFFVLTLLCGSVAAAQEASTEPAEASVASVVTPDEKKDKAARWYHAAASANYRQLVITDETPRNDMAIIWSAKLTLDLPWVLGLSAYGIVGVNQRFVAQTDELGSRLRDTELGASYHHSLSLAALSLGEREVGLDHRLRVFLPTSFASDLQDLYLAAELRSNASVDVVSKLTVGLGAYLQYRWHQYAEQNGYEGGMLVQLSFGPSLYAEYAALESEAFGNLLAGADLYSTYYSKYPSRESFESDASAQRFWQQGYGWDVYAQYSPPKLAWLSVEASIGQGGYALRDGIFNVMFAHRDETELSLTLTATY